MFNKELNIINKIYIMCICIVNMIWYIYLNSKGNENLHLLDTKFLFIIISLYICLEILLYNTNDKISRIVIFFVIIMEYIIIIKYNPINANMFIKGDELTYRELATILNSTGKLPNIKSVNITSYLYILIINIVYFIFQNDIFIKLFNLLFWIIGNLYIYKIVKKVFEKNIANKVLILIFISPLGIWFANSYYKDSFLYLCSALFIYNLINYRKITTMGLLIISVLIRPGYIFPMGYALLVTYLNKNRIKIKKSKSLLILMIMLAVIFALYKINPYTFNKYLGWLSFSEGRVGDISNSIFINILLTPVLTFITMTQPLVLYITNPNSIYFKLDIIGSFEGVITMLVLPFSLLYLSNYKKLDIKKKNFIKIGLAFYFSLALIGYIFTYRHITYSRWILYTFGSCGFSEVFKNKKEIKKLVFFMIVSLLCFIGFSYFRSFIFVRSW